jgi:hypothetical protein
MAAAHLIAGRFEVASSWAEKALRELPVSDWRCGHRRCKLCAGGRSDGAARDISICARSRRTMSIANLKDWIPFRRPQDLELFADGLRKRAT